MRTLSAPVEVIEASDEVLALLDPDDPNGPAAGHAYVVLADDRSLDLVRAVLRRLARTAATAPPPGRPGGGDDFEALVDAAMAELSPATDESPASRSSARRIAQARLRFLEDWECLDGADLARRMGSKARNPSKVTHQLRQAGKLLALPQRGQWLYPSFQIDDAGHRRPAVEAVVRAVADAGRDPWATAFWLVSAQDALDQRRPVDLLDTDPDAVVLAARRLR